MPRGTIDPTQLDLSPSPRVQETAAGTRPNAPRGDGDTCSRRTRASASRRDVQAIVRSYAGSGSARAGTINGGVRRDAQRQVARMLRRARSSRGSATYAGTAEAGHRALCQPHEATRHRVAAGHYARCHGHRASGLPGPGLVIATLLGGALAAGSANAINCYWDRDIDQIMTRTQRRALPAGRVAPRNALIFGLASGVLRLSSSRLAPTS